jgi:secreted PhoX family phosphatase
MVTDISTSKHNQPVTSRVNDQGESISQTDIQGIFGNNSIWCLPTSGEMAGNAYLFGIGPMECETTGPFFSPDQKTLFLAVQHPGEKHGIRKDNQMETRKFVIKTTAGEKFQQERLVPLGSNWPRKGTSDPPQPAVVAIRRLDNQPITTT